MCVSRHHLEIPNYVEENGQFYQGFVVGFPSELEASESGKGDGFLCVGTLMANF